MTLVKIEDSVRRCGSCQQPFFLASILGMLGLGVGAATAIFSVVYGVLLKPLPFLNPIGSCRSGDPSRASAEHHCPHRGELLGHARHEPDVRRARCFPRRELQPDRLRRPRRVSGARVSVGFFRAYACGPSLDGVRAGRRRTGRRRPARAPLARVVDAPIRCGPRHRRPTITLDGRSTTVLHIPAGTPWLDAANVFGRPPAPERGSRQLEYVAIGRLKPGVTFEAALQDIRRVVGALELVPENKGLGATLERSDV